MLLSQQLQAFVAVTACGTVHGAAEKLFLTQTAVTQRIKALERNLKTSLFVRTRRGMTLTSEGVALLRYCQRAEELEGEALAAIHGGGNEVEVSLSITAPTSIMMSRVIPAANLVAKQYPNLLLQYDINDDENRQHALRTGRCEFAILFQQDIAKEMQFKLLKPEQYVLVGPAAWKGRKLKEIIRNERIVDYNPADQATFDYLKQYDLFAEAQHGRHFANRTDSLASMVIDGLGYTTLAKEFVRPYLDRGQMILLNHSKTYEVQSALTWYERPEPPAYFTAMIEAIC